MKHYLIIGSGLIGRLTAWRLIEAGHQVAILSKDDKIGTDSAGYMAAAMVAPATEAVSAETIVKTIGLRSYALWPQWLAELAQPVYYQNVGTLVVAHKADQAELDRFHRRARHVLMQSDFQQVDHDGLAQHEPALADHFDQALRFEQEACIDNRQLYQQLEKKLDKQAQWIKTEAIVEINEDTLSALTQQYLHQPLAHFDAVIDCRGNGAKPNLADLRSVRGEVIRVQAPEVDFRHAIRLMHPRYPFYLAPRPNHEYVLGATVIESDDMSPVSVRSALELMSALYSLHKGFAEARVLEMSVHCRPALPDNLPTIKRTSWGYSVNGFHRHGYLFGPAIVSDLLAMLAGQPDQVYFGELYDN